MILADEGREVEAYLGLASQSTEPPVREAAATIAVDSALHARDLAAVLGRNAEPWHVSASAGYLRSLVYGFNDGLTANFGLVAGVIGASVDPHIVIITGVAGAIADACQWARAAISPPRARPKCRHTRSRWNAASCS